jgi:phage gpG-like protein
MMPEFKIMNVDGVINSLRAKGKDMLRKLKQGMNNGMRAFERQMIAEQFSGRTGNNFGLNRGKKSGGVLFRSWNLRNYQIGYDYVVHLGTSVRYARIHQYGGTIQHPGGTPYITLPDAGGNWKFIPLSKNKIFTPAYRDSTNARIRFTQPHAINMPKRLYVYEEFQSTGIKTVADYMVSAALGFNRAGKFIT